MARPVVARLKRDSNVAAEWSIIFSSNVQKEDQAQKKIGKLTSGPTQTQFVERKDLKRGRIATKVLISILFSLPTQ